MGQQKRFSVLLSICCFPQGNDSRPQTVLFEAKHKLDGNGSLLRRLGA